VDADHYTSHDVEYDDDGFLASSTSETTSLGAYVQAESGAKIGSGCSDCMEGTILHGDARWIAALSPAVAVPLEATLRAAAHDVEVSSMVLNSVQFKAALADRFAPALDLARAVLGSGVDTQ
jgi:hypothetical protein